MNGVFANPVSTDDRRVRRNDLPTLIVVSSMQVAEWYQRAFDPRVVRFLSVNGPVPTIKARAILVATEAYINSIRDSKLKSKEFQEYLDHIRCRLAPECTDNFFII